MTGCATSGYHRGAIETNIAPSQAALTSAPQFIRPVSGAALVPFGFKENQVAIKGVVLAAKEGELVVSAEVGRVSFVDANLPGYGKTIIVEHSPEYSTVYARNSEILVQVGQIVQKGQAVARSGLSGKGRLPQLYFEIRKNSKPQDPARYI